MPQAIRIHNDSTFTRKFEALSLYRETVHGERFVAGTIDGEFTVEFDENANWTFGGVSLELDNLRHGIHAKGHTVELDPDADETLILLIYKALERDYGSNIEAWVMESLEELAAA